MYTAGFLPALGHCVTLLLTWAQHEQLRQLRLESLACVRAVIRPSCKGRKALFALVVAAVMMKNVATLPPAKSDIQVDLLQAQLPFSVAKYSALKCIARLHTQPVSVCSGTLEGTI